MMTIKVNNGSKAWLIRQHTDAGWKDMARIIIDESEIHTFIETFLKGVSGLAMFPEKTPESSAHSFTEGFDHLHDEAKDIWMKSNPTIGEQIEFMETVKKDLVVPFKFKSEIAAIINTLRTSQVFEHQRMLIQNIDFEGVIEKLIRVLKSANRSDLPGYVDAVTNAEVALGMIDAFKQKSSPPEWVKNFAQVKTVTNGETQWSQYPKEMQKKIEDFDLRGMLVDRMLDVHGKYAIADAIIMAIELKKK